MSAAACRRDAVQAFPTALPRTRTQQRAGHRDRLPVTVLHNPLPDALLGWERRGARWAAAALGGALAGSALAIAAGRQHAEASA